VRAVLCSNNRVDTDEASLDGLDEEGLFDALEAAQAELLSVLPTTVSFSVLYEHQPQELQFHRAP